MYTRTSFAAILIACIIVGQCLDINNVHGYHALHNGLKDKYDIGARDPGRFRTTPHRPEILPRDELDERSVDDTYDASNPVHPAHDLDFERRSASYPHTGHARFHDEEADEPMILPRSAYVSEYEEYRRPDIQFRSPFLHDRVEEDRRPDILPRGPAYHGKDEEQHPDVLPRGHISHDREEQRRPDILPRFPSHHDEDEHWHPEILPRFPSRHEEEERRPPVLPRWHDSHDKEEQRRPDILPRAPVHYEEEEHRRPDILPRTPWYHKEEDDPMILPRSDPDHDRLVLRSPTKAEADEMAALAAAMRAQNPDQFAHHHGHGHKHSSHATASHSHSRSQAVSVEKTPAPTTTATKTPVPVVQKREPGKTNGVVAEVTSAVVQWFDEVKETAEGWEEKIKEAFDGL